MGKKRLFKTADGTTAWLELHTVRQILADKGLDAGGDVQRFHTQNVLRRIVKYMPYRTGMTIRITGVQTDIRKPLIVTDTPYARFLYHGKRMVSNATGSPWGHQGEAKHKTSTDLHYTKDHNPQAGPYWDRRLSAAEGAAMAADLQRYIRRKGG